MFGRQKKQKPAVKYLSPADARKTMIAAHLNSVGWAKAHSDEVCQRIMSKIVESAEHGKAYCNFYYYWNDIHPNERPGLITREYVELLIQHKLNDWGYQYTIESHSTHFHLKIQWFDGEYRVLTKESFR